MKSVILAGGLGTRLLPHTKTCPKPMLPLGKKPILEHLIEWNRGHGVRDVVLCVSHMGGQVRRHFGDGSGFGVTIEYASSKRRLETAGQLKTAERFLDGTFACMYGDSLFGFDLNRMIRQHKKGGAVATIGTYKYRYRLPYGVIGSSKAGRVTSWEEKPERMAEINMGCYVMEPEFLKYIPKSVPYGMDRAIKRAMRGAKVQAFHTSAGFEDIGDAISYERARARYGA